MGAREGIEYLVLKKLGGSEKLLKAVIDYANGESPSIVVHRYNITKETLRSFIAVLRLKTETMRPEPLIKLATNIVLRYVPTVVSGRRCRICGEVLYYVHPEGHVARKHRVLIRVWSNIIIDHLKGRKI